MSQQVSTKEKCKEYKVSRELMLKQTEENRRGYILWETYLHNSKLECWNLDIGGIVEPVIFQIWPDGAGYRTYVSLKA